jgi:hypothetical protein
MTVLCLLCCDMLRIAITNEKAETATKNQTSEQATNRLKNLLPHDLVAERVVNGDDDGVSCACASFAAIEISTLFSLCSNGFPTNAMIVGQMLEGLYVADGGGVETLPFYASTSGASLESVDKAAKSSVGGWVGLVLSASASALAVLLPLIFLRSVLSDRSPLPRFPPRDGRPSVRSPRGAERSSRG